MNKKNTNYSKPLKINASFTSNEKIVAVNDVKLNGMVICGSKTYYNEVYFPKFARNMSKSHKNQNKNYTSASGSCKKEKQCEYTLFQNTAINSKLNILNHTQLQNYLQNNLNTDEQVHRAKQHMSNLQKDSKKLQQKSTLVMDDYDEDKKYMEIIVRKHKNGMMNILKRKGYIGFSQQKNKVVRRNQQNIGQHNKGKFNQIRQNQKIKYKINLPKQYLISLITKREKNIINTPSTKVQKCNQSTHLIKSSQSQFTKELLMPILTSSKQRRRTQYSERTILSQS